METEFFCLLCVWFSVKRLISVLSSHTNEETVAQSAMLVAGYTRKFLF